MVVNTSIISTPVSGVASLSNGGLEGRDTAPPSLRTSLPPQLSPSLLVEEDGGNEEEEKSGRELR